MAEGRNNNSTIKYDNIVVMLKEFIMSGRYSQKLPGQRQLAKEFEVNVITLRKALSILEKDGFIERRPRYGFMIKFNAQAKKVEFQSRQEHTSYPTNSIGLIMPQTGHFFQQFYELLTKILTESKFNVYSAKYSQYYNNQDENDKLKSKINDFLEDKIPHLLFMGSLNNSLLPIADYKGSDTTVTSIISNDYIPGRNWHEVLVDYFTSGYLAAKHIIDQGARDLIFILSGAGSNLNPVNFSGAQKLYGFRQALYEAKIPWKEENIFYEHYESVLTNNEPLLEKRLKDNPPRAIIASADMQLSYCFKLAKKLKLSIPNDLALVGCNDTPWCSFFPIHFSSVNLNQFELAKSILQHVKKISKNPRLPAEKVIIPPKLIVRESSIIS